MSGNSALFSLILMVGCESVFVADPINPELPKYTETGIGMAGAYLNDELWWVNSGEFCWFCGPQFTIKINDSGYWQISFFGEMVDGPDVTFRFQFKDLDLRPDNIMALHGQKIELDGINRWLI
jgi:hypothetical protein